MLRDLRLSELEPFADVVDRRADRRGAARRCGGGLARRARRAFRPCGAICSNWYIPVKAYASRLESAGLEGPALAAPAAHRRDVAARRTPERPGVRRRDVPVECSRLRGLVIHAFGQDVRDAFRALRHSRRFAAWVVGSLAIGMAVTIAALALLNATMVLPFPQRHRSASPGARVGEPELRPARTAGCGCPRRPTTRRCRKV